MTARTFLIVTAACIGASCRIPADGFAFDEPAVVIVPANGTAAADVDAINFAMEDTFTKLSTALNISSGGMGSNDTVKIIESVE
jgi:hypothetical protein